MPKPNPNLNQNPNPNLALTPTLTLALTLKARYSPAPHAAPVTRPLDKFSSGGVVSNACPAGGVVPVPRSVCKCAALVPKRSWLLLCS